MIIIVGSPPGPIEGPRNSRRIHWLLTVEIHEHYRINYHPISRTIISGQGGQPNLGVPSSTISIPVSYDLYKILNLVYIRVTYTDILKRRSLKPQQVTSTSIAINQHQHACTTTCGSFHSSHHQHAIQIQNQ